MITPEHSASSRTKNRLREHKNLVKEEVQFDPFKVVGHEGKHMTLFLCNDEGCLWGGWLPTNEFKEIEDLQAAADASIVVMNPKYRGCVMAAHCILEARHDGDCEFNNE